MKNYKYFKIDENGDVVDCQLERMDFSNVSSIMTFGDNIISQITELIQSLIVCSNNYDTLMKIEALTDQLEEMIVVGEYDLACFVDSSLDKENTIKFPHYRFVLQKIRLLKSNLMSYRSCLCELFTMQELSQYSYNEDNTGMKIDIAALEKASQVIVNSASFIASYASAHKHFQEQRLKQIQELVTDLNYLESEQTSSDEIQKKH